MTSFQPSRPRASFARRARRGAARYVSVAVWLLAIVALLLLARVTPTAQRLPGLADARESTLLAPVAGRLVAIAVQLHEVVEADAVVARFDDRDVRLRLTQTAAALERLRAELAREGLADEPRPGVPPGEPGAAATTGSTTERRRLGAAAAAAQLAALATSVELEDVRLQRQAAAVDADRLAALARQAPAAEPDRQRARTAQDALQQRLDALAARHAEQRTAVDAARTRLAASGADRTATAATANDAGFAPFLARLDEHEAAVARIALDAQALDVRAPMRGHVAAVHTAAGEWAPAGHALLTIVDGTPRRILAYVPDALRSRLDGASQLAVHRADQSPLGASAILSISPTVVRLPQRLWRDPQREEWGYEIVLAATGTEAPGERLQLTPLP